MLGKTSPKLVAGLVLVVFAAFFLIFIPLGESLSGQLNITQVAKASWRGNESNASGLNAADSAGDFNGDGFADIIMTSLYANYSGKRTGKAFIVYGPVNGTDLNITAAANATWYGAATSVAGVGDVNNDGYDDVLIGNYGNDEGGPNAGKVYLVYGGSNILGVFNISTANATWYGEASSDRLGEGFDSLAGAGDVNNDGYDDML
ncbi:MAG: VCBS repeat-containing protein, partial [Candidatus Aenigmarchaeota archaeon]